MAQGSSGFSTFKIWRQEICTSDELFVLWPTVYIGVPNNTKTGSQKPTIPKRKTCTASDLESLPQTKIAKKSALYPCGLTNESAFCYQNSVLQMLYSSAPFKDLLKQMAESLRKEVHSLPGVKRRSTRIAQPKNVVLQRLSIDNIDQTLIVTLHKTMEALAEKAGQVAFTPHEFRAWLGRCGRFKPGEQHDVSEFYAFIREKIMEEAQKLNEISNSNKAHHDGLHPIESHYLTLYFQSFCQDCKSKVEKGEKTYRTSESCQNEVLRIYSNDCNRRIRIEEYITNSSTTPEVVLGIKCGCTLPDGKDCQNAPINLECRNCKLPLVLREDKCAVCNELAEDHLSKVAGRGYQKHRWKFSESLMIRVVHQYTQRTQPPKVDFDLHNMQIESAEGPSEGLISYHLSCVILSRVNLISNDRQEQSCGHHICVCWHNSKFYLFNDAEVHEVPIEYQSYCQVENYVNGLPENQGSQFQCSVALFVRNKETSDALTASVSV